MEDLKRNLFYSPTKPMTHDFFRKYMPDVEVDTLGYSNWHYAEGFVKNCEFGSEEHKTDIKLMRKLEKSFYNFQNKYYPDCKLPETGHEKIKLSDKPTIFMYWHQGLENLPDLQSLCVNRVFAVCGKKYDIRVLDYSNVRDYIDIPDFVVQAMEERRIWIQHFVDYIRICLLAKYEAIWLDATIYVRDCPDYSEFDYDFWSMKNTNSVFKGTWAEDVIPTMHDCQIYAMGGKSSYFYDCMKTLIEYHIKRFGLIYSYFFMYYLSDYLYERNPIIREQFDALPNCYEDCELLANHRHSSIEALKAEYDKSTTKMFKILKYQSEDCDEYKVYKMLKDEN